MNVREVKAVLGLLLVVSFALFGFSLVSFILGQIEIHQENTWCKKHDGVYISKHCIDERVVLR